MSYIPPSVPWRGGAGGTSRAIDLRTVDDPASPLDWRFKPVHRRPDRSVWQRLVIKARWQIRLWRWEYGW